MTLPEILIIDDLLSTDSFQRSNICSKCSLLDEALASDSKLNHRAGNYLAIASFCSGQRQGRNSHEFIEETVRAGFDENGSCRWSLVLLDVQFGGEIFGLEVYRRLSTRFPALKVVLLTEIKQKDLDDLGPVYLSKDKINTDRLKIKLLENGNLTQAQRRELLQLKRHVVAESQSMASVFLEALTFARVDTSILILGETGTGKEEVARYIHDLSPRRSGPFIAVNCAAVPETLIESELFGYEKGSFTGAVGRKRGKFEAANGGTLFLDEIADMPLEAQVAILRALQERKIARVGGLEEIPINIRLLSATARDLGRLMEGGQFREDLYYRIAPVTIKIPPLQERREDIPPLADLFLKHFMEEMGLEEISFSKDALDLLTELRLSGNVRQLKSIVWRAAIRKGNNEIISGQDVLREVKKDETPRPDPSPVYLPTPALSDFDDLEVLLKGIQVPKSLNKLHGKLTSLQEAHGQIIKQMLENALRQMKIDRGNRYIVPAIKLLKGKEEMKASEAFSLLLSLAKRFKIPIPPPGAAPEDELEEALQKAEKRRRLRKAKSNKGPSDDPDREQII